MLFEYSLKLFMNIRGIFAYFVRQNSQNPLLVPTRKSLYVERTNRLKEAFNAYQTLPKEHIWSIKLRGGLNASTTGFKSKLCTLLLNIWSTLYTKSYFPEIVDSRDKLFFKLNISLEQADGWAEGGGGGVSLPTYRETAGLPLPPPAQHKFYNLIYSNMWKRSIVI